MTDETTNPDPAPQPAPDAVQPDPAPIAQAAPETPPATAEPEPPPEPKPKRGDVRFAQLSARKAALEAELLAAQRERDAARELLAAQRGEEPPAAKVGAPDVETRARQLVEQREFERNRQSVVNNGVKELGNEAWQEKTQVLADLGAYENPAFMQALVELPDAHKLVARLADDEAATVALLNKRPAAMAAEMGRMAAQMEKPAARNVSNAPKPVAPVSAPAVIPEATPYDENLSMAEYVALRRKTAPRHLGGSGRPA